MSEPNDKGRFTADIPDDAIAEAMKSVEKHARSEVEEPVMDEVTEQISIDPAVMADAQLDSLRAQLDESQSRARQTGEHLKEAHDRYLRASADLENYKKRAQREKEDLQKFGVEKLLRDLIPVLDNLERALAHAPAGDPMAHGVQMVLKLFEDTLGRHGVQGFSAVGQKFDPRVHEAMMQSPTAAAPPGTVIAEHARGFMLNERLIRPAMVVVAAPAAAADPTQDVEVAVAEGGTDPDQTAVANPQSPPED
jgi:molecular chaperone GrpE